MKCQEKSRNWLKKIGRVFACIGAGAMLPLAVANAEPFVLDLGYEKFEWPDRGALIATENPTFEEGLGILFAISVACSQADESDASNRCEFRCSNAANAAINNGRSSIGSGMRSSINACKADYKEVVAFDSGSIASKAVVSRPTLPAPPYSSDMPANQAIELLREFEDACASEKLGVSTGPDYAGECRRICAKDAARIGEYPELLSNFGTSVESCWRLFDQAYGGTGIF
jgi:hypothetical protein